MAFKKATTFEERAERLRRAGQRLGLWRYGFSLKKGTSLIFGDFSLPGKTVLEIGCGRGILCLWAATHGCRHVVGLEPMEEGFYEARDLQQNFATLARELELENVELLPCRVQDYAGPEKYFDLVLSVASINHLDEQSCLQLDRSETARESYVSIFSHVRRLMKDDGKLVIADASNRSLFGDLGVRNPFSPYVDWSKHQPPRTWAQLLSRCGFGNPQVSWMAHRLFWDLGIRSVPRMVSYFTNSAFRLEMDCVPEGDAVRPVPP